jgi:hypothetical protein
MSGSGPAVVAAGVGVRVTLGVRVAVRVGVVVASGVGVVVRTGVAVAVGTGVAVTTAVAVAVGAFVKVAVATGVGVGVGRFFVLVGSGNGSSCAPTGAAGGRTAPRLSTSANERMK